MPARNTIESAAYWAAVIDADDATDADRAACEAWCNQHPSHRETLERLIGFTSKIASAGDFEQDALRQVAEYRPQSRRRIAGIAGIVLLLFGIGLSFYPSLQHAADYQTSTGEQRDVALTDGSRLTIDTNGAVNVRMDDQTRAIDLVRGQILATVAHDPDKPFVVRTPEGSITALGTAFVVRREGQETLVSVIQSHVRACPLESEGNPQICRKLGPGEQVRMTSSAVVPRPRVEPGQAGLWATGWLEADDREVSDLIAELNRYRKAPIHFRESDLRGLRVSGGYPLRDTDRALDGIARSAGLEVERSGAGDVFVHRKP